MNLATFNVPMPKLRNSNDSAIVAMENIFQMMFLCLWLNSRFGGWPTARLAPHDGASLTNYNKSGGHQEAAEPNCQQRITESRRAADSTLCYAQQSCHHQRLIKTASDGLHLYRSWRQTCLIFTNNLNLKVDAMDRNIQDTKWIQRTTAFIYFICFYFYIFVFWG